VPAGSRRNGRLEAGAPTNHIAGPVMLFVKISWNGTVRASDARHGVV